MHKFVRRRVIKDHQLDSHELGKFLFSIFKQENVCNVNILMRPRIIFVALKTNGHPEDIIFKCMY